MPKPITTYEEKLTFLREELERMLNTEQIRLRELNANVCNAAGGTSLFNLAGGDTSALEVAAGSMDVMMLRGARSAVFARYVDALRQNKNFAETTAEATFRHLERAAVRELAVLASSLTSCSSSWVTNQRKNADLTAFGDVVRLFVDIAALEA